MKTLKSFRIYGSFYEQLEFHRNDIFTEERKNFQYLFVFFCFFFKVNLLTKCIPAIIVIFYERR